MQVNFTFRRLIVKSGFSERRWGQVNRVEGEPQGLVRRDPGAPPRHLRSNPYSGSLATDCYLYRAKPGKASLGFVSLYMAKNTGMSECEIEVVEDGIWLRILGERFAYYRQ